VDIESVKSNKSKKEKVQQIAWTLFRKLKKWNNKWH